MSVACGGRNDGKFCKLKDVSHVFSGWHAELPSREQQKRIVLPVMTVVPAPSAPRLLSFGWLAALATLLVNVSFAAVAQVPVTPVSPSVNIPTQVRGGQNSGNSVQTGTTTQTDAAARRNATDATRDAADRRERSANGGTQEVPTEFQRLVQESTGVALPIFGANLFSDPNTFSPVSDVPVSNDYVIGPGDEIRIQIFGAVNQQADETVDRNGNIPLRDVGDVHVAGVRYSQLQPFLKSQLDRVFRNFDVNVNLGQLRTIPIFVTGNARRPGTFNVSSQSTLLNALFSSGGPLPQGSLRDIQVLRENQTVVHFDLYDLLLRGDKSKDVSLQPGDVIYIPTVGSQVAITGSVNNPAIYEIQAGTTVGQLIKLTGGDTSVALGSRIRVERIFEHSMRSILDLDLAQTDPKLENGDIVTVGTILDRFKDAVTLRGNVAFPGRYNWRPGLRILDIVPTRDLLITRDYYRRLNQQGNTFTDYNAQTGPVGAVGVAGSAATQAVDSSNQNGATSTSGKGGGSVASAVTNTNNVFGASTDIILSAPDVDLSYAVIQRLSPDLLTTSLIAFNPGKLYLQGDATQNLELQPGDVITFFSTADLRVPTAQQTRIVHLEGEFVASGVYSVQPGETLRGLLRRAGGLTADAYLYGSQFTRLSTRRIQQQRLNEYADSLEAQVSLYAAAGQSRAISTQDTAATVAAAQQGAETVARLRRVVPLGRIVLELKPDSRTIDEIPDLPLEDGDRFVVPRVPSTVSVEGQVYSANAFVFQRKKREHDYLRQAGGPDRDADKKREFILRADGSVFSRQYGNVDKATMFPGDTIVVPPQIDRRAVLRNLLDLSSIVGQFGLGAAAINVLK